MWSSNQLYNHVSSINRLISTFRRLSVSLALRHLHSFIALVAIYNKEISVILIDEPLLPTKIEIERDNHDDL